MIQFQLPHDIERHLKDCFGDLNKAAHEAFLIQSYREARLSVGQIGEILGVGVLEAEEWLADRNVPLNYSAEDLEEDRRTLARLLADSPSQ